MSLQRIATPVSRWVLGWFLLAGLVGGGTAHAQWDCYAHQPGHPALRRHRNARRVAHRKNARNVFGGARPHHRDRQVNRDAGHVGVIARAAIGAGQ